MLWILISAFSLLSNVSSQVYRESKTDCSTTFYKINNVRVINGWLIYAMGHCMVPG